jgi:hypothetical protein
MNDLAGLRNSGVVTTELAGAADLCIQSAQALIELCQSIFALDIGIQVCAPSFCLCSIAWLIRIGHLQSCILS